MGMSLPMHFSGRGVRRVVEPAVLYTMLRQPLSTAAIFNALLPLSRPSCDSSSRCATNNLLLADIRAAVITTKRSAEVQLVRTIPGYGEKTAATIVACVPKDLRSWGAKQKVG